MEGHCEEVFARRRTYVRAVGFGVLLLCFAAGVWFSFAYFTDPISLRAQSASAAASHPALQAFAGISLVAKSAIVIDADSREVLYQENSDAQLPLASLSKVPLILAVSEVLSPESVVTIEHATSEISSAGILRAGTQWRVKDLMSYTLVASSNDGALILAQAADESLSAKYSVPAGSAAVSRMNSLARELGLRSIYFLNPTGLDESATQSGAYGSAYDVALLFTYAAKNSLALFADTATTSITITSVGGHSVMATNTDRALDSIAGIIIGKTGLTDLAGGNLAVVFEHRGKRYVAVVLGSSDQGRFSDMLQLVSAIHSNE